MTHKTLVALLAAALLAGCASLVPQRMPTTADAALLTCARRFEPLDAAIDAAGARDAEADRIAGFAGTPHATAFVGRRHFDDADLIERRFVIPTLE